MVGKKGEVQCINDEILEKMSLENRYKFLNNNLAPILKPKHLNFMKEAQDFFVNLEKRNNITHNEDLFEWIPEIGKAGLITRMHDFKELDLNFELHGMTTEFMRMLSSDFFDTQMTMSIGGTVFVVTPLLNHNEGMDNRLKALKELVTGQKVGCMCITEPERGSDAVHMLTTCDVQADGSFNINGEKIYQTNGPTADWAVVYACTEKVNGNTMAQFLVDTSWDGWSRSL